MKSLSLMLVKLEEPKMSKKFLAFDVGGTTIKYAVIDEQLFIVLQPLIYQGVWLLLGTFGDIDKIFITLSCSLCFSSLSI